MTKELKRSLRDLVDDLGPAGVREVAIELDIICSEKAAWLAKEMMSELKKKNPKKKRRDLEAAVDETDVLRRWINLGSRFTWAR